MNSFHGIIINAFNFGNYDKIITCLTAEQGVVRFLVKRGNSPKYFAKALITPLTIGEYILKEGKNDLMLFIDGSIIDEQLDLRNDYDRLECAGQIIKIIQSKIMPNKYSADIYMLVVKLLNALKNGFNPQKILSIFMIKFLLCEGLLSADNMPYSKKMSPLEQEKINSLIAKKSLIKLIEIDVDRNLKNKIDHFFEIAFN